MLTRSTRSRSPLLLLIPAACLLAVGLWIGSPALAQLKKGRALKPDQKSCLDCHKKRADAFNSRTSRHAPVREGNCESCHLRHGVVGVLRLSADDPQICLSCHGEKAAGEAAVKGSGRKPSTPPGGPHTFTHPPGESLKCGVCHDPHGSDLPSLLKTEGNASCLTCHKPEMFEGASKHRPETAGCLTCHDPHGSAIPGALARKPEALCAGCHEGTSEAERKGHGGSGPAASTCLSCHSPHASASKGLMRSKVHPPMAEGGGCEACHTTGGEGARGFALSAAVPDLCLNCHEDPRKGPGEGATKKADFFVHPPLAEGNCLSCHAPHASDQDGLLVKEEGVLCGTCHVEAEKAAKARAKHTPALNQCSACHLPHAGRKGFLRAAAPSLCETCHAEVKKEVARKSPHPPAGEGECLTCHAPHGSDVKGVLKEPQLALCSSCHEGISGEIESRFVHRPAAAGACTGCHEPHGADGDHLVSADPAKSCLSCHKEEAKQFPQDAQHAPFANGDCLSCHRPHSASRAGLLVADPGPLCRKCHADLEGEKTAAVKHLPIVRGQCLSCHGFHGGQKPGLLLRIDVKSICVGCHQEEGRLMSQSSGMNVHAVFRKESCLVCHAPHVSNVDGLLAKGAAALCAGCHDATRPSMTAAHKGLLDSSTDCTGCHEPHASQAKKLLLEVNHAPFAAGDCAVCHQGGGKP